jgi:hypothetical protein
MAFGQLNKRYKDGKLLYEDEIRSVEGWSTG